MVFTVILYYYYFLPVSLPFLQPLEICETYSGLTHNINPDLWLLATTRTCIKLSGSGVLIFFMKQKQRNKQKRLI